MHFSPIRSRAFWFGLPVLVFLLWAWGRSNVTRDRVLLVPGSVSSTQGKLFWYDLAVDGFHEAGVDFGRGDVVISRIEPEGMFAFRCGIPATRFMSTSIPVPRDERRWFPPLRWHSKQLNADNGFRFVSIPYWLLTAGYAGVWGCGMVWWQCRKARLLKLSTTSPP